MDITKLEALGLSPEMIRAIQDTGYEEFTPNQEKAIPVLLEGRDILGKASTGLDNRLSSSQRLSI